MSKRKIIFVLVLLVALFVLLRMQTIPQLALAMQQSYNLNASPNRTLEIAGVNKWYSNTGNITEYNLDLQQMKALGFRSLRVLLPSQTVADGSAPEFANTVKQYYPMNTIPILFNGNGELLDNLTVLQAEQYIDIWVLLFPNVTVWEIINEPPDNKPDSYYTKIITLIDYLHIKTSAPVTIGFNNDMPEAFNRLVNHVDIVSFHYYPALATAFGTAEVLNGAAQQVLRLFPELLRLSVLYTQSNHSFPVPQSSSPPEDMKKILDWLSSYNKPFLISEWGYAQPDGPSLDQAQATYVENMLNVMKHYENPNFLGYEYYSFREFTNGGRWSGIETYERQLRPAAKYFTNAG